jgi:hypothetical protein
VRIDRTEQLRPADATEFVSRSTLTFVEGDRVHEIADEVASPRLGSAAGNGYAFTRRGLAEIACTTHTRPHDKRPADLRLASSDGFAMALRSGDDVHGTSSTAADPDVYAGAPVYYDYRPGKLVSYWFFYAGSALPALISRRLFDHNRAKAAGGGFENTLVAAPTPTAAAEDAAARYALAASNPELFALASVDELEGFGFGDIWDKLDTFVHAIGRDTYLCHEGDWERVTVFLDPKDELGDPPTVNFDAHGEKSQVAWADVDKEDGRLVVYSGLGSHASLPKPGYRWKSGDYGAGDGLRWQTWHQLEPVRQAWWGYGGAWGAAGAAGDLTGPLGPSPYKEPPQPV